MEITDKNYPEIKKMIADYEFNKEIDGRKCSICENKANNWHNLPGCIKVYRCKDHFPEPYPMLGNFSN